MSERPVRVAVTGAAGQIGYSLLFRIAAGDMLGPDQPVILQMLEIPQALGALDGVTMELEDGAFPLLEGTVATDDPEYGLRGRRDRPSRRRHAPESGHGAFRSSLRQWRHLHHSGPALSRAAASPDVKVLVVGNPANTNALIAMNNAKGDGPIQFHGDDPARPQQGGGTAGRRLGRPVTSVRRMTIWGNHSSTQYPDLFHCEVDGKPAHELVDDQDWIENEFIPTVANRGAAIIEARGASSAASAANAAIGHVRDWWHDTPEGDWVSMGVPSDGSYGVPEGLMSSFPCICRNGRWEIVQGLEIDDYSRKRIDASVAELTEEREAVKELGLI